MKNTNSSVLIIRGAFGYAYEPAWLKALNEIGVAAEMLDCHELTLPGVLGRVERRILVGPGINRIRSKAIERARSTRPDIILAYQGHYLDKNTIDQLKDFGFVTGYHNDDPFGPSKNFRRYHHFNSALPSYHGFHVYRPINLQEMREVGVPNVGLLMPGYIPWMDYPRVLSAEDRKKYECDVVFAGHYEDDVRGACLSNTINSGLKLNVFGDKHSWNKRADKNLLERLNPIYPVFGDDYRKAICGAKIALCFFSKSNRDKYTRRVFEITACGGFLLSERTDEMLNIFAEGESAEYFSSAEEYIDKVKFYVKNDSARNKIARSGFERVRADGHDLHSRMRFWLNEVLQWRG